MKVGEKRVSNMSMLNVLCLECQLVDDHFQTDYDYKQKITEQSIWGGTLCALEIVKFRSNRKCINYNVGFLNIRVDHVVHRNFKQRDTPPAELSTQRQSRASWTLVDINQKL